MVALTKYLMLALLPTGLEVLSVTVTVCFVFMSTKERKKKPSV